MASVLLTFALQTQIKQMPLEALSAKMPCLQLSFPFQKQNSFVMTPSAKQKLTVAGFGPIPPLPTLAQINLAQLHLGSGWHGMHRNQTMPGNIRGLQQRKSPVKCSSTQLPGSRAMRAGLIRASPCRSRLLHRRTLHLSSYSTVAFKMIGTTNHAGVPIAGKPMHVDLTVPDIHINVQTSKDGHVLPVSSQRPGQLLVLNYLPSHRWQRLTRPRRNRPPLPLCELCLGGWVAKFERACGCLIWQWHSFLGCRRAMASII